MSEWITDRLPTKEDAVDEHVFVLYNDHVYVRNMHIVSWGEPWAPIPEPTPCVKSERYYISPSSGVWPFDVEKDYYEVMDRNISKGQFGIECPKGIVFKSKSKEEAIAVAEALNGPRVPIPKPKPVPYQVDGVFFSNMYLYVPVRFYVNDMFFENMYSVIDKYETDKLHKSNRFGDATHRASVIPFFSENEEDADAVCDALNKFHSENNNE